MKKNDISIILMLLIIPLVIFSSTGCFNSNLTSMKFESMLFYALPDGGLSYYQIQDKKTIAITEEKDYYPSLDPLTQTLYFIRLFQNKDKGDTISYTAKIMQMNLSSKRIRALAPIYSYKTTPSLNDQFFFLNSGKILMIQNDQRIQFYDTKSGKPIPENLLPFLPELNQYSKDGKNWIIRIRQAKHYSFYKSEKNLNPHEYYDSINYFGENGIITPWLTIPKEKIYEEYIDGYSYSQVHSLLAIGYSGKIQLRDTDNQVIAEFPGKHPFFIKTYLNEMPMNRLPLYKIQAFVKYQSYYVLGSLHWAGRIRIGSQDMQLFTDQELSLSARDPLDSTNLFEHITVFRITQNPPLLILTSVKDTEKDASASNIIALESIPDQLVVLRLDEPQWIPLLQFGETIGLKMEWKDLDQDKLEELLIQYSASTFSCEGRFQSAGRSLVWIDVYKYHQDIRQYINDSALFPTVYRDLLKSLEPLHERALTAIRLKDPILCQDDLKKLEQLIKEAKGYIRKY